MSTFPLHYTMAVVDIERFGVRSDPDQQWLRDRMYEVLASAAGRAGIPWGRCASVDRGDSLAVLIPASVSKPVVAEGFVRELLSGLRAHNRRSQDIVAMRMRMSLHAGEVSYDGRNWVGTALNTACRLVDVPELREALQANLDASLVLCVSDLWYQTVVRHDHGLVDHHAYTKIVVRQKEVEGPAWLYVAGLDFSLSAEARNDSAVVRLRPRPGNHEPDWA